MSASLLRARSASPFKDVAEIIEDPKFQSVTAALLSALLTVIFVKSKLVARVIVFSVTFSRGLVVRIQIRLVPVYFGTLCQTLPRSSTTSQINTP